MSLSPIKFLCLAIWTNFRLSFALRAAFFITLLLTILKQIMFLVAWNFFFLKYKMVQGWDFNQMLLMYGIVSFSLGALEAFFYGVRDIPKIIETGQLDNFLLQPKNVILNIALSRGDFSALGEMVAGILFIIYSGYFLKSILIILIILAIATLFVFSLYLYLSCIAFFTRNSADFIRELLLNSVIVATQPNAAYRGAFKMFTFTVLPVAFLSYLPIEFLRTGHIPFLLYTLLGTLIFFGISIALFQFGLKRYESGNMLGLRN